MATEYVVPALLIVGMLILAALLAITEQAGVQMRSDRDRWKAKYNELKSYLEKAP